MPDITHDAQALRAMLTSPRRIAMVGASNKPSRDSFGVFQVLQEHGHRVVPVNPTIDAVLGVPAVPDLAAARKALGTIDIVDVFRAPEHVPPVVEETIAVGADAIWFQLGVVNQEGIDRALQAGLDVVVDRCIKVEQRRFS